MSIHRQARSTGRMAGAVVAFLAVLATSAVCRAYSIQEDSYQIVVSHHTVEFSFWVCNFSGDDPNVYVDLFYHATSPPPVGSVGNRRWSANISAGTCDYFYDVRYWTPNGRYDAYIRVTPRDSESLSSSWISGPREYRVGPDLWIQWANYKIEGTSVKYRANVCNIGTDWARKFRVGFYYDLPPSQYPNGPPDGVYSDKFKAIEKLGYHYEWRWWWGYGYWWKCLDDPVEHIRHNTPNGTYWSWVKVDSGQFVEEARENNNIRGPMFVDMSNPDIIIVDFEPTVSTNKPYVVDYYIKAKNIGTKTANNFWLDVYFDRAITEAPQLGEPGDVQLKIGSLAPGRTYETHVTWQPDLYSEEGEAHKRCSNWVYDCNEPDCKENENCLCDPEGAPCLGEHWVYHSWIQADADEYLVDADRSTNLEGAVEVRIPRSALPEGCEDNDGDGAGVGLSCTEPQDCDDDNPNIHPGAPETCGDQTDNDCDGNVDECCAGVDCCDDEDDDGSPVGPDCDQPDCDDDNPQRNPMLVETCDDGIDNDCDGHVDDCCVGSTCCDEDNDGYGVGEGCEGPQDCNDGDPGAGENLGDEICGDGQDNDCDGITDDCCEGVFCCDQDNDGYGVGVGCPGPQDPDDDDPNVPGDEEECGDGLDNDMDGIIDEGCPCSDHDGDGYCVGEDPGGLECWLADPEHCPNPGYDCDDNDDSIHPDADEICDGVTDENCNGTIDDSASGGDPCLDPQCVMACATAECVMQNCPNGEPACLYGCGLENSGCSDECSTVDCIDGDGDGWGTGGDCAWPDCNDEDPAIHPGAEEICDGVTDENCNGTIDDGTPGQLCPEPDCVMGCAEGMPCEAGCSTDPGCLYSCGSQNSACVSGCDTVDCVDADGDGWGVGEDCAEGTEDPDDNDPSVHPGAGEICGDGRDQNGDGVADDGCLMCIDLDRDGYGIGSHCLEPDCNDLDPTIHPSAREKCGDKDRNCDGKLKGECEGGCAAVTNGRCPQLTTVLFALLALLGLAWRHYMR